MKKLIVNADDFGFSKGINQGVVETFTNGIVTSSTIMVNMPYAEQAFELAKKYEIPVGIHHNITAGNKFFSGESYLFGKNGKVNWMRKNKDTLTDTEMDRIIEEYELQTEYFTKHMGKPPTHYDHHHNIQKHPGYKEKYFDYVASKGVPLRTLISDSSLNGIKHPDRMIKEFFEPEELTVDNIITLLKTIQNNEVAELITHPSIRTGETLDSYTDVPRSKQVEVLTDEKVSSAVKDLEIKLITYSDL